MPVFRRTPKPPATSGGRVIDPPIAPSADAPGPSIETLVDNNRLLRAAFGTRIGDMKLWELIAATRREILTVAAEYSGSYRDVHRPSNMAEWIAQPIVMGGHQPELFHAGVWLKNFVLDAYARQLGGTAINLVIDTDRCARTSIDVPVGSPEEARFEKVPFDLPAPEMAWEERGILDADCFASFGRRASDLLRPLEPDPVLRRWWPLAVERADENHRLGLAIAQARHMLEERYGLETLELPMSELVRLPTVMVFIGWLLANVRLLHEAYNGGLATYRAAHRERSLSRPMPDLAVRHDDPSEGDWLEIPWWIWSREDPRRRRAFANLSTPGTLTISDMETLRVELPISPETSPSKWVDALSRMEEHAIRLRPRAIITTLVARMLIADVFVHGIGGAAYDQLTDEIVRRLTGCEPPRFAVVSGTLRLPVAGRYEGIERFDPEADLQEVHRVLRDLEFHPERHLLPVDAQPQEVRDLVAEKRRWIDTHPTITLAKRRCREIRAANARLATHTRPFRDDLLARVGPLAQAMRARNVLASRTHPWCFFPEKTLKKFLLLETG
ncbi:MAG: hypothetical protein ACKOYJ_10290 [Planctomycetia bacterium]